jgi:aliphatic sulfonates family ABC transporter substrate-binding protein
MAVLTLPNAGGMALTVRAKALVFEDPQSRALLDRLLQIAPSDATALVIGETGTGKEIVARHLHNLSARRDRPFVAVNCAALTPTLIESELFGHEKGAFTGAVVAKPGWFESANGGTLFLDEIGDLPIPMQVKLLRVLQEHEVVRVGGRTSIPIDVRLVAATNIDLADAMRAGRFREDLYYRLKVAVLALPPLRDRPGDVLPLALHFLDVYARRLGSGVVAFEPEAARALERHGWPGNIRELENVVHHALLVCRDGRITVADLRLGQPAPAAAPTRTAGQARWQALEDAVHGLFEAGGDDLHLRIEHAVFRAAYDYCDRNQLQTARLLGISRNVVRARLIEAGELTGGRSSRDQETPRPDALGAPVVADRTAREPVRIGFQPFGILWMLRASGVLERIWGERGRTVAWAPFTTGPELVDAMGRGAVDLGVVGEMPPLVAQAARAPVVYLAAEPPAPEGEAIVVLDTAPVHRVADLRGRRVAVSKGTNAHFFLLRALEQAELGPGAVDIAFATPEEGRRQFRAGDVDAWAIWDPLFAEAEIDLGVRALCDARHLATNRTFYVGARRFLERWPDLAEQFLAEIAKLGETATANADAVVARLGDSIGLPAAALRRAIRRGRFGLQPFDGDITRSQQNVADISWRGMLIPRRVSVAEAGWRLSRAAVSPPG